MESPHRPKDFFQAVAILLIFYVCMFWLMGCQISAPTVSTSRVATLAEAHLKHERQLKLFVSTESVFLENSVSSTRPNHRSIRCLGLQARR